jgi:hypothetical protein
MPQDNLLGSVEQLLDEALKRAKEGATPAQAEELIAARKTIAAEKLPVDRAIRSFERAADAIKNGIRVFISYKFTHVALAEKFRDLIREYGVTRLGRNRGGQPAVFMAERDMAGGKEYRTQLRDEIDKAHWFFLLLPDVQFDREWPIWEAGFFQRGMTFSERLICVHHKSVPVSGQLEDLQAYESSPERLEQLFGELFFTKEAIPGMDQISFNDKKKDLPKDMAELSALFKHERSATADVHGRFVMLEHKDGVRYDKVEELLAAPILEMKNLTEAFERPDDFHGTFGELIESVNDDDHGRQWIDALRGALHDVVNNFTPELVEVPFSGAKRGWSFRPNLYCVWKDAETNQIQRFHVIFTEEVGGRIGNVPGELDALATALRWSFRSWWEIYGGYDRPLKKEDVDEIRRFTQCAEQELQSRGGLDPDTLASAFEAAEREILKKQFANYNAVYRKPDTNDGKIDRAFQKRDPKLMKECLDELKPNTLWFLKAASKRFAELIEQKTK